ncbi:hypothetical protein H490_0108310 [Leucobacter sp. UCD-THU]|uniref:hypothetical protein n=1 Tax=Leucobacter sp. UCD-THU TaxID=1292023 RepID=UPI00038224D8|nr:hypothetical protein [Leucobacter sp. UCD-THU]EYT54932.1 hypothetical protein H490_0108310 [Leucobacter sp. UCD-THU]
MFARCGISAASAPATDPFGPGAGGSAPGPSLINRAVWSGWKAIAWGLPILLLVVLWTSGSDGWDVLVISLLSPVLVPTMALLDLIPYFRLRKLRPGIGAAPSAVTALMLVHWWGFAIFGLSLRGVGDSGGLDSVLGNALFRLPEQLEGMLALGGGLVSAAAWLAAVAVAFGADGTGPVRATSQWPWAALVAPPVFVAILIGALFGASLDGERDGAGSTESAVAWMPQDEARALQQTRWDETQQRLVPLREAISDDDWRIDAGFFGYLDAGVGYNTRLDSNRSFAFDEWPELRLIEASLS